MPDNPVSRETQRWIDRLFTAEDDQYDRTCDLIAGDCRQLALLSRRDQTERLKKAHHTLSGNDVTLREIIQAANSLGGRLVIRIRPSEKVNPTFDPSRKPTWMAD